MTRLILFRHGVALERGEFEGDDDQRPLTAEGRKRTLESSRGLRRLGVRPDAIFSSPLVRALQTAEIAARGLRCDPALIQVSEALRPDADPGELVKLLGEAEQELLCVGHAPNLDRVLGELLAGGATFSALKKSGAARVDLGALDSPPSLTWLLGPRALRRLAR
jgi:phosphohistidine phosphatase